jgi:hypothetical protein
MPVRTLVIAALVAAAVPMAGCGKSLDANTSCASFLKASPKDQDAAVSKVAAQLHAGESLTPLGRPNISYICANEPDKTLGDAVRITG